MTIMTYRTSLRSALYVNCQHYTLRNCSWAPFAAERRRLLHNAPAASAPCSSRSIFPARRALSSKPAARRSVDRQDRQKDGQTLDRFIDPAPHTMLAVSITTLCTIPNGHWANLSILLTDISSHFKLNSVLLGILPRCALQRVCLPVRQTGVLTENCETHHHEL